MLKKLVSFFCRRNISKDKMQFKHNGKVIGEIVYWVDVNKWKEVHGDNHPVAEILESING